MRPGETSPWPGDEITRLKLGTIRPCWICGPDLADRLDAGPGPGPGRDPVGLAVRADPDLDLGRRLAGPGRVGLGRRLVGRPVDLAGRPADLAVRDDSFHFPSESPVLVVGSPRQKTAALGIGSEQKSRELWFVVKFCCG